MNKIFSISALAAGMLALASCNEIEPTTPKEEPSDSNLISFSVDQNVPSSRTQYSASDSHKIEWVMGDRVTIWCDQPESGSPAIYKVTGFTEPEATVKSKAKISAIAGGLTWGTDVLHTFCAVYGESSTITKVVNATATAKLKYSTTQTLTQCENGSWANMQQAYMVAFAQANKPTDPQQKVEVPLSFYPVMTTLDIVVKGMTGNGAEDIFVQSLSITTPQESGASYDDVLYDEGGDTYFDIDFNSSGPVDQSSSPIKGLKRTITFVLQQPQKVAVDGSLLITVNLPRIAISGTSGKQVTVTIDTTDDSNQFTLSDEVIAGNKEKIITPTWVKHEKYVDLGLPSGIMWATCNLGAKKPSEYGEYYGWGCTDPYASTDNVKWDTYFGKIGGTGTGSSDCGTDKDPLKEYVYPNNKSISLTEWDVVHKRLGSKWRMPTKDDFDELKNNCTWVWDGNKGIYTITGKNNNSIVLPAAGYRQYETVTDSGIECSYWSSSPSNSAQDSKNAFILTKGTSGINTAKKLRWYGYPIRPVWEDDSNVASNPDIDRQGSSESSQGGDWQ